MINCVAIDDEPRALQVIENHVARIDFLSLAATFTDPFEGVAYVNENEVDLVFLDINMPDIDGLTLLKNLLRRPLIIFTTAHSEYAIQSYEVEAVDYLLKPFDFARFHLAVTRVNDRLASNKPEANFFFVNTGNQKRRIAYADIMYVEGEGNYVNYAMSSGTVLVRSSVKDTLKLLSPQQFVQIHRSFIVALQWIEKIEDNHVHLPGKRIPIGAKYREEFYKMLDA